MRVADGGDGDGAAKHGEGQYDNKQGLLHYGAPQIRSPRSCGCSNLGRALFPVCELAHTRGVVAKLIVASLFPTYRIRFTTVGNVCNQRRFAIARVVILSP